MNTSQRKFAIWAIIVVVLILGAIVVVLSSPGQRLESQNIAFSQFLNEVDQGKVRGIVVQGQEIHGAYVDGRGFSTYYANDPNLIQRLYAKNISIAVRPAEDSAPWYVSLLISWLPFIALIGVWMYLSRQIGARGLFRKPAASDLRIDDPKLWRDRADEARKAAELLTDPEVTRRLMDIAVGYEQLAAKVGNRSGGSEK